MTRIESPTRQDAIAIVYKDGKVRQYSELERKTKASDELTKNKVVLLEIVPKA